MSSLKKIREKFGISQQQIADWLGISCSMAEHYERGIHSLPTHALLQLGRLEIMIVEFEKSESGSWDTNHGSGIAVEMDKTGRLQQQLSVLKSRYTVLQQQMLLIKKLMDNCNEQTSEKEKLWLQMLYQSVNCRLSKFDETKQLPIKAKILEMRVRQEMMNRKVG